MDPARIRLTVKLGTLAVGTLATVISLHSFSLGGGGSAGTSSLLRNGLAGICADQQATAAASGQAPTSSQTLSTAGLSSADQALARSIGGGSLSCPPSPSTAAP